MWTPDLYTHIWFIPKLLAQSMQFYRMSLHAVALVYFH